MNQTNCFLTEREVHPPRRCGDQTAPWGSTDHTPSSLGLHRFIRFAASCTSLHATTKQQTQRATEARSPVACSPRAARRRRREARTAHDGTPATDPTPNPNWSLWDPTPNPNWSRWVGRTEQLPSEFSAEGDVT